MYSLYATNKYLYSKLASDIHTGQSGGKVICEQCQKAYYTNETVTNRNCVECNALLHHDDYTIDDDEDSKKIYEDTKYCWYCNTDNLALDSTDCYRCKTKTLVSYRYLKKEKYCYTCDKHMIDINPVNRCRECNNLYGIKTTILFQYTTPCIINDEHNNVSVVKSDRKRLILRELMYISTLCNGIENKYKISKIDVQCGVPIVFAEKFNILMQSFLKEIIITDDMYDNIRIINNPFELKYDNIVPEEPVEKNLIIKQQQQHGGDTTALFMGIYRAVINEHCIIVASDNDQETIYTFDAGANTKERINTKYFAEGSYSIVFMIKNIQGEQFVLKLNTSKTNVAKYKSDMRISSIVANALPKIISYGEITIEENQYKSYYMICPLYNTKLSELSISEKIDISLSLIVLLRELVDKEYMYTDLKYDNIGVDKDNRIIMIDYDSSTIKRLIPIIPNRFPVKNTGFILPYSITLDNTFQPIFVSAKNELDDSIFSHGTWRYSHLLLYMFIGGLVNIFIKMFLFDNYSPQTNREIYSCGSFSAASTKLNSPIVPLNDTQNIIKNILLYSEDNMRGLFARRYDEIVDLTIIYDLLIEAKEKLVD